MMNVLTLNTRVKVLKEKEKYFPHIKYLKLNVQHSHIKKDNRAKSEDDKIIGMSISFI